MGSTSLGEGQRGCEVVGRIWPKRQRKASAEKKEMRRGGPASEKGYGSAGWEEMRRVGWWCKTKRRKEKKKKGK